MRKYLLSLGVVAMGFVVGGCQSYPGFTLQAGITLPPTIKTTNALAAIPTAMGTTYAVEGNNDVPVVQRQIQVAPAPVQRRLMAPIPAERIPMPKESLPPCGSAGNGCGAGGAAE